MLELINKLIEDYKNNKFKESPYSQSYYFFEDYDKENHIGWYSKPNNSIRISDHWNFYSQGETHCKIDDLKSDEIIKGWKICKYDNKKGTYSIICDDEQIILSLLEEFKKIDKVKMEIKRIENEKKEAIAKIEREKREKEYKKELKIEIKNLLEKINKNIKLKEDLKKLINLGEFHTTAYGSRNYKETPELKLYKKFSILFKNTTEKNNAPRGGKIGNIYVLSKKDINKLKKVVAF